MSPLSAFTTQAELKKTNKNKLQLPCSGQWLLKKLSWMLSQPCHLRVHSMFLIIPNHFIWSGFMNAILFQKGKTWSTTDRQILMYYSSKLDNVSMVSTWGVAGILTLTLCTLFYIPFTQNDPQVTCFELQLLLVHVVKKCETIKNPTRLKQ